MAETLRSTIRSISHSHLKNGNKIFGQCLSAVGWVGGTVPEVTEEEGLVELPMADVMAGGVVVGSALAGQRPIYVVRYQGFQWFNSPIIANYAGKSKEIWDIPCPIFIRSIAMEGNIGPVASSSHHGIFYRMPGVTIASPMTPDEYRVVYDSFMLDDCPYYVSEHRGSYGVDYEFTDTKVDRPKWVLFPFSITRFECEKLIQERQDVSLYHQLWVKPLAIPDYQIENLNNSKYGGVVLDDDYPNGVAKQIAYELMMRSGKPVHVLALEEKAAGFQRWNDNLPPKKDKILEFLNQHE